jgi:hypothetical protein
MLLDESVKGLWFLDDPYIQWHTKLTHDGNGVYLTIQWKLSVPIACNKSSPLVPTSIKYFKEFVHLHHLLSLTIQKEGIFDYPNFFKFFKKQMLLRGEFNLLYFMCEILYQAHKWKKKWWSTQKLNGSSTPTLRRTHSWFEIFFTILLSNTNIRLNSLP